MLKHYKEGILEMKKEVFNKLNITIKEKVILFSFIFIIIVSHLLLFGFNLNVFDKFIYFLLIPLTIAFVLVIHELIHILLFKYFGKGQAKIKIIYDKELGAIAIYQCNKEVLYSLKEVLAILLTPMLFLTVIGFILLNLTNNLLFLELIKLNILVNLAGSSLDFLISLLLLKKYKRNDIKIYFDYKLKEGMELIVNIK